MPHIRRRAISRGSAPLQVTNHRDSVGVDSLSSVAPPCYTSQREVGSSVAASDDGVQSINPSEDNDSVSMHSCAEIAAHELLPSPYSTEDLFADSNRVNDHTHPAAPSSTHTQSCVHGYTHTHSQCTIDSPTPYDMTTSPSQPPGQCSPFPDSQASSPYPYIHQARNSRYSSNPTASNASHHHQRTLRRASDAPSPRSILYHHRPSSQPAAIGHLPPQRPFKGYELHHLDPSDQFTSDGENVTPIHTPLADSTITFLQEDPYATPTNYRPANHRRAYSSLSTSYIPAPASSATHHHSNKTRATNYVSLSRKSTFKKAIFFGRKPVPSSITGNFTIDPGLHIPNSLLKAVEPRSHSLADVSCLSLRNDIISEPLRKLSSKVRPRSEVSGPKVRRKNLLLEVENGGIDVDVHLVPSSVNNNTLARYPSANSDFAGRRSVDNHQNHVEESQLRPNFSRRPSSRRSQALEYDTSAPEPNRTPSITLIDLKLKSDSRSRRRKAFPLMARIHAPSPRPPFHLLASTIALESPGSLNPSSNNNDTKMNEARHSASSPLSNPLSPFPDTPTPAQSNHKQTRTKPLTPPRNSLIRNPLSKSNLTLHLPRSFRGPLTIHVAAGNIDDHVCLSKAITSDAVVLSESAFSRGYYLGGLSSEGEDPDSNQDPEEEDVGGLLPPPQMMENGLDRGERRRNARRRPPVADEEGERSEEEICRANRLNNVNQLDDDLDPNDSEDIEWTGDKVDVVIGDGKVYLQFLEEENPFGKKGRFWKNLIFCR